MYITGPIDSTVLRDRRQGYLDAMAERGLTTHVEELVQDFGDDVDRPNCERARQIVSNLKFPTAIFTADATRLAVVLQLVEEMEIPPSRYALGCFDEPYLNLPDELMLVRVLQPLREIGRRAVDLTLGRIEGNTDAPARLLLPPEILVTVGGETLL
jgi:LacI family transcriptional regulator